MTVWQLMFELAFTEPVNALAKENAISVVSSTSIALFVICFLFFSAATSVNLVAL
jgi:hypothetical protein